MSKICKIVTRQNKFDFAKVQGKSTSRVESSQLESSFAINREKKRKMPRQWRWLAQWTFAGGLDGSAARIIKEAVAVYFRLSAVRRVVEFAQDNKAHFFSGAFRVTHCERHLMGRRFYSNVGECNENRWLGQSWRKREECFQKLQKAQM